MEDIEISRHSLAHILAKAIMELYKDAILTIGPAIENGFYYDIDMSQSIVSDDYSKIEKKMQEIINRNEKFERKVLSKNEALELFAGNVYKTEIINELDEKSEISVYYLGEDFFDLCRGPHIENAGKLQNYGFKIQSVNGAYWRGSEKNKMLQRIYVYAFKTKKELSDYILMQEEAKKRDHNKIGRELGFFTTVDLIGQGLPVLMPKGARVIQLLQRFVEDEEEKRGYLLTKTPLLAKSDFYKVSGHWDHYREGMFVLGDETKDKEVFALRPMTCPFQFQVYLNKSRSYKDLPMRLNETSTLFRNESSGEMHGLIRVRQFTISEGHIACLPSQLEEEFKGCLNLAKFMLATLGLDEDVSYRFSKWDENNKGKYLGSSEQWENVQNKMREILNDLSVDFSEASGEAAFYGPKLDIQIKNVFGKEDTLITIQIDFQLAERFNMEYTDQDGEKKFPYVIHRTSIGCYERTLALLLEKYAGALPLWLSPEQVKVISLTERNTGYANSIKAELNDLGIRTSVDNRNEKVGYKIRDALSQKVPYLIIVGDKEEEGNLISFRTRGNENVEGVMLSELVFRLKEEIRIKK